MTYDFHYRSKRIRKRFQLYFYIEDNDDDDDLQPTWRFQNLSLSLFVNY